MSKYEYSERELWRHGEGEVSLFHLFSAVAVDKTVLVFAEARYGTAGDDGCRHDIYMKKSTDGGVTFSENVCLVCGDGGRCFGNPVPVNDNGRIILFYSENFENARTDLYFQESVDLGDSWSQPRALKEYMTNPEDLPPFNLAGPGHGIKLSSGRIAIPFWHRNNPPSVPKEERGYAVSLIFSDDGGKSWTLSERIGQAEFANESRIVETSRGIVRNVRGVTKQRYETVSTDMGVTWSPFTVSDVPEAAACDAGMIAFDAGREGYRDMVVFSHPSGDRRRDTELCISYDGGATYPDRFPLVPGQSVPGYSDLCVIFEELPVIGVIHCRDDHVLFTRVSMEALTGGKFDGVKRTVWLNHG